MKKWKVGVARILMLLFCLSVVSCNRGNGGEPITKKVETTHEAIFVSDVSLIKADDGMRLEALWHNESDDILTYGRAFELEVKRNGAWEKVPMKDNVAFTLEEILVYPDASSRTGDGIRSDNKITLNLSGFYDVKNGHSYRATIKFFVSGTMETVSLSFAT